MTKSINLIYFSPTGNTRRTLEVMAEAIGDNIDVIDLTCSEKIQKQQFDKDDFIIFGMPVYGGRIPIVAKQRLENIRGDNTPCLVVVTYGNRDYDDALLELSDFAKTHGFVVKGAAAVIGRHTYGEIQIMRPDSSDFAQDREFAVAAMKKTENTQEFIVPGTFPYKDGGVGGKFRPITSSNCTKCGICVKGCPVHAIDADCSTISDACLACFRCIRNCPIQAKNMDTEEYLKFADMFTQKLCERKENQYFI